MTILCEGIIRLLIVSDIQVLLTMSFDWETSKENILPIKKGRALSDFSDVKTHSKEALFEKTLAENFDDGDILLSTYVQYFTYVRRRAGDSRAASKALLEVGSLSKYYFCLI